MLSLITNASVIVQLVMALLLFLSVWSWFQIFQKMFALKRAAKETAVFEEEFWTGSDLNALYNRASQKKRDSGGLERVFEAGFKEFVKHKRHASRDGGWRGHSSLMLREHDERQLRVSKRHDHDLPGRNLLSSAAQLRGRLSHDRQLRKRPHVRLERREYGSSDKQACRNLSRMHDCGGRQRCARRLR